jgi:hypothetical protein
MNNSIANYIVTAINASRNRILMSDIHYFNLYTTFSYNISRDTKRNTQLPSLPFLQYPAHHLSVGYTSCVQDTTYDLRFTSHGFTLLTLMNIVIVNINLQTNQSSMSFYSYIYFMRHHMRSSFYTTVSCSILLQCSSITLEILLLYVLYVFIHVFLPNFERWKI